MHSTPLQIRLCPFCNGHCNCSLCAPKRGEKYAPKRNGGWRSWITRQKGGSYCLATVPAPPRAPAATKTKSNKSKASVKATPAPVKKRAPKTTTPTAPADNVQVFDSSWSATAVFTVSDEPLHNAFLHVTHVAPVQQQLTVPLPPPALPPATSLTPKLSQELQRRWYLFIGKPREAWGRLVSLPDPDTRGTRSREGAAGEADSVLWLGTSSRRYWRAAGRSGGEGDRRRWTPTPIIPVRMARRTRMQIRTGTLTTGSDQGSSWCQLLS